MKKQDIITEIKAAYERYKTIKPEEFNFGDFITSFDDINNCGKVCCLWGWEPKFGVLGVKWLKNKISIAPAAFLGWGYGIIIFLYSPYLYHNKNKLTSKSTLLEVLSHWEKTINTLETSTDLDHLLNLD
jgi:hypothetical protein